MLSRSVRKLLTLIVAVIVGLLIWHWLESENAAGPTARAPVGETAPMVS